MDAGNNRALRLPNPGCNNRLLAILTRHRNAQTFLDLVQVYLQSKEAENNLPLGVLQQCLSQAPDPNHLFIAALLTSWLAQFFQEAGETVSSSEAAQIFSRYLAEKSLYVWEHHGLVSMIRKTRPTPNGIVVPNVFTPGEHRNKGYATTCVYHFSQKLLQGYQFCTLYTDLANPTSNSIYQKIGYKAVADSLMIGFGPQ